MCVLIQIGSFGSTCPLGACLSWSVGAVESKLVKAVIEPGPQL